MSKPRPIVVGGQYGKLTVLGFDGVRNHSKFWNCVCVCGKFCTIRTSALNNGSTKSCGCLQREIAGRSIRNAVRRNTTHGKSNTPAYQIWTNMMRRCYRSGTKGYADYGGRGIGVCERWKDFANFLEDLGQPPERGMQLERINNYADYSPKNCCWATRMQQCRNKRNNINITYQGRTQCLKDWANELRISYKLAWKKIRKGMNPCFVFVQMCNAKL